MPSETACESENLPKTVFHFRSLGYLESMVKQHRCRFSEQSTERKKTDRPTAAEGNHNYLVGFGSEKSIYPQRRKGTK